MAPTPPPVSFPKFKNDLRSFFLGSIIILPISLLIYAYADGAIHKLIGTISLEYGSGIEAKKKAYEMFCTAAFKGDPQSAYLAALMLEKFAYELSAQPSEDAEFFKELHERLSSRLP